jgi:hypothetical protein
MTADSKHTWAVYIVGVVTGLGAGCIIWGGV